MQIKELKPVLKEAVLQLEKKFPFASAFAAEKKGESVFDSTMSKAVIFVPTTKGITFTIFNGKYFIELSTDKIDTESINDCCKTLLKNEVYSNPELVIDPGEKISRDFKIEMQIDPLQKSLK
ncbi:MAG: hypothetical protein PHR06_12995, partial [Candidatus Cloacimonetes bacterium]|nr:hypothetical protein [Candidatus Cloacimonadota bacterium]